MPNSSGPASAIGHRLKVARVKAGMALKDVAGRAGITSQALSRLERGEVDPKWSTIERITRALGLDLGRAIDHGKEESEE